MAIKCATRPVKTSFRSDPKGFARNIDALLDEARTMFELSAYHENIVNLQGIVLDVQQGAIKEVKL